MSLKSYIRIAPLAISGVFTPTLAAADYNATVTGTVIESQSGEKCIGASYKIFMFPDTTNPVVFNVTNDNGDFKSHLSKPGNYLLKVEYLGMKDLNKKFDASNSANSVDLGILKMLRDEDVLEEVVVTGRRKLVQSDGATLTYNVTEDPDASTNSTIEILRKVPMVTVDAEDNIKVNGQSNFKIYLNGKEDPMLSGDPKTILKAMPASSIKKIEVITEPGAKYDAEGTGGILNIVTETKQNLDGYLANVNFNIDNRKIGGAFYGRMKYRNVTASAQVNYANGFVFKQPATSRATTENLTSDIDYMRHQNRNQTFGWDFVSGNVNLSWEPDTINLFTLSANIYANNFSGDANVENYMISKAGVTQWSLQQFGRQSGEYLGSSVQLSYQHNFSKDDHFITASYLFDYGVNDSDTETMTLDDYNHQTEHDYENLINNIHLPKHTFQIDYSNRFSQRHLLEAGAKGVIKRENGDTKPYFGADKENAILNDDTRVKMYQFQDIFALYASYTGNFGKWSVKGGVRYEFTRIGLTYKIGDYQDFSSHMNDLVPNAAVSYRMGQAANLRLAYQMRISRPGLNSLNPYQDKIVVGTVKYGNPDLDNSRSHSVSLNYSNYGGKLGGSAGIYYSHVGNGVTDIIFMKDNILNTTYANVGKNSTVGMNVNVNWQIIKDLDFGLYMGGAYEDYRSDSEMLKLRNHGWRGNLSADANYTMPGKIRVSAYGGYGSGWIDAQSSGDGWYYYGLGFSRSFLKNDMLTLRLTANNLFPSYRVSTWGQTSETAISRSVNRFRQWGVGFSVSMRLGGLRSDVKRTGAKIESEDTSGGSSMKESNSSSNSGMR